MQFVLGDEIHFKSGCTTESPGPTTDQLNQSLFGWGLGINIDILRAPTVVLQLRLRLIGMESLWKIITYKTGLLKMLDIAGNVMMKM